MVLDIFRLAPNLEHLNHVIELPVDISDYCDRVMQAKQISFLLLTLFRLTKDIGSVCDDLDAVLSRYSPFLVQMVTQQFPIRFISIAPSYDE